MSLLEAISQRPAWFHYLRKLPELNYRATKRRIRSELPKSHSRVLDVGCGTGEFCGLFDPKTYAGVDVHRPYVEFASKRFPDYSFSCVDARRLDHEDHSFDFILINGVVHHLSDEMADALFSEIRRVIAVDGILLLIEDIPAAGSNFLGNLMHSIDRGDDIRRVEAYRDLFSPHFSGVHSAVYRSGICDYALFRLSPRAEQS